MKKGLGLVQVTSLNHRSHNTARIMAFEQWKPFLRTCIDNLHDGKNNLNVSHLPSILYLFIVKIGVYWSKIFLFYGIIVWASFHLNS